MDRETRTLAGSIAIRADGETPRLVGTAIKWNTLSQDLGGFREQFAPDSIVTDADFRVVNQHDNAQVFGRAGAGTASVRTDEEGAHYEADPPDAQWARDALASIKRADIYQNSFSFSIMEPRDKNDVWTPDPAGGMIRTVLKAHVYEMGPQTNPAYVDTAVAVRGLEAAKRASAPPPVVPAPHLEERAALMADLDASFRA